MIRKNKLNQKNW